MDFEKHVVSVRSGGLISKQGKKWHLMANNRLCVEEPFNTDRNLGNTADDTSFRGIHLELRRAFTLLSQANLDECCEQYIFPPQEEKVWVKPPPQPRPVITRSQSQSGRSGKGGGSGGNNRNGNSGSKQRNGQSNRRASSSAAPVKMAYPGAHQNLQQQIPNIAGRDGMSGNQIHDRLFQHYQYLQAQEQQLRLHMQQRAQANIHAQITSQLPVALYPTGPDGQQHTPLNLKPFPTPGSQPSQPGSPAAMSLAPHFYYPPGTILVHQPIGRNITNMPNPQQSSTNPPSPSLASAQPNVTEFRRSGLRAPSTTESSAAQSIRSRSQPPRTRVNRPPAQYASGSPALQGPQLGFRTLQEYQKAYLQSKGPDRQMVPIDLNSLHLNPAMTDPDTGYMGYFVDEATAHGTLFPPMQPRDSMKDPINRARGVSPSLSRLRAQTSRSPSPSYSNNSNRDRSISFYTAQSALSPPYTFGNVMNGNQVPNSGPVIVDGSSDTSGYVTPPESLFFQPPASDAASLSEDYPLNTPETTTTDTPLQDAIESLSLDIGEQRLTNSMPNVLQFGELPAVATSRNGITKMEEVAKPLGNKRAISPSETSTSGEPSNALGIDFTPPIRKIPSPPAIPNMSYSQAPAQAAVPSKSLASVLKPSLPQLSPVREVRTPSPTATRTNSGALETLNSSLASKTGHNRSISLSGKDMVSSPLSESTRADDKTKAKALTQPGPLANGFVNGVVTHNVEPQQQQPTPPLQTSGWQQSTGRKKKSRKGASVGSAPLIANPSNGERKGG